MQTRERVCSMQTSTGIFVIIINVAILVQDLNLLSVNPECNSDREKDARMVNPE